MISHNLAFVISNLLALVASFGLAFALLSGRTRPQLALAALSGYPLVIILTLLCLGAIGYLSPVGVYVVLFPMAIAALLWVAAHRRRDSTFNELPPVDANGSREHLLAQLAIPVGLLSAYAGVILLKACWSGTQFFADDLGYHGPTVARWIREGHFSYVARNFTAYYPFNSELLSLWYVLPFHADAWAALAGLFWLVLIACSAGALARELGLSTATALLVVTLTICSPDIHWQVRTFSPTDLAAASFIFAGIYFAGLAMRRIATGSATAESLYAGLLIGAAVGCKITVIPVFLVVLVAVLFSGKPSIRCALVFCVAAALTGSFWYVRNWINTGNPLFPAAIGPFAGPWTSEQQSTEKLIHLVGHSQSWPQLLSILKKDFDWPISLAVLSLVGYLAALGQEFRRTPFSADQNNTLRRTLLASGLALLAVYPFVPFSGNDNSWRYITAPFLIGLVLYGKLIDDRCQHRWFWTAMALVAIVTCWPGPGNNNLVALVGGALGLAALYLAVQRMPQASSATIIAGTSACASVLFIGLAALTHHQQQATDKNFQDYGFPDQPIGKAWSALDAAPPDSRIACFMNRSYDFLPLFGRRYQFDAVAVEPNGRPSLPLHERFGSDPSFKLFQGKAPVPREPAELLNNLRQASIHYILVSKWPAGDWPPQHALLAKSDQLHVLYQDDYSVIWKIKHER